MKQKNGFVISTTLYSIFGIMLISVFYILYLLSNNRYVLTSSIDDIKESLFSKTTKVYLELGYYGDLPDTIKDVTDLELQKEVNNRLKENAKKLEDNNKKLEKDNKRQEEKLKKHDEELQGNKFKIQNLINTLIKITVLMKYLR